MSSRAFISGCAGTALSAEEKAFFSETQPLGLILFDRNCETPDQVRQLIDSFKSALGTDQTLVLIDQEGGRVQRLKPPQWSQYPPARAFTYLYEQDPRRGLEAVGLVARLMARDLTELGINVNCIPVLDVPAAGAHEIIGSRAYGTDIDTVIALGRAVAESCLQAGVLPVIKHIPGHGRAGADSHESLPTIEAERAELESVDFAPFRALKDMPLGMTGHLLIPSLDENEPVSTSSSIIGRVIRGDIGFKGLLLSDDLSMGALSGHMGRRTHAVLSAGCDVALHCNGDFGEMCAVAEAVPELSDAGIRRFNVALSCLKPAEEFDVDRAQAFMAEALAVQVESV